ncbi:MAG: isochorismatase family protein [Candidatus Aminicenantes bacterium]|nr:isochorismatase family protein [Candidatus Aminicenantes bacterium]
MKRHPQILNRAHTALLVVDVQTRLTKAVRNGQAMVAEVVKLVRGFRILGLPVFVTEQYPKGLGHTEPGILEALGGNSAVVKATFSCCGAPDLVSGIRSRGVRQILVSGTEAHVCVQQTALDLLSRDFQVQLAVDAVASRKELDYRTALDRMARSGVILTSVESALFELLEVSGTAEFKQVASLIK